LIDACLPREVATIAGAAGHAAVDVRDIGMRQAGDPEIAAHAQANQFCLLTEDWGFADIRVYPPEQYSGIVVFETDNSIDQKLTAVRNLFDREDIVQALLGRLAIVTISKIRLRPPL
jgi:predicted nuclease of predicted toxin-antitoxin system